MSQAESPSGEVNQDAVKERELELDVLDVLLPCRSFSVSYKVAEVGRMSLTSEFLLRLVHVVEGIAETDAALYFGFTDSEIAFVVNDLTAPGYVERRNGALWLTLAGRSLFRPGLDVPEIYEVEPRTETHSFDLLSLSPVEYATLSSFEAALPELKVTAEQSGRAGSTVPMAFRRHFASLVRRVADTPTRQALFGVDSVTPLRRFAVPIPVRIKSKPDKPGVVEPDVTERWSAFELDDRADVVSAVAAHLKSIRVSPGLRDDDVFQELLRIAPDTIGEFSRRGTVNRASLFREAVRRAGDLRSDRQTALLVGTLFTDGNFSRLKRAAEYSSKQLSEESAPNSLVFWHAPAVPTWGATRRLPQILEALPDMVDPELSEEPSSLIGVLPERAPRYLERAFTNIVVSRASILHLEILEVLLISERVVAVIIHASMTPDSFPVPLGLISFDPAVVGRATDIVRDFVIPLALRKVGENEIDLEDKIKGALL